MSRSRPSRLMAPPVPRARPYFYYYSTILSLFLHLSLSSSLLTPSSSAAAAKPTDTDALTIFRSSADAHGILAPNWSTADACSGWWRGVGCSAPGRVVSLSLPSLDLRGPLDPLAHLDQLRVLDLRGNRLNGTLVDLALPNLTNLKLLYLSRNDLSGEIPAAGVARLRRLVRLDLSDNNLCGSIPDAAALSNLTRLLTLRLQDNLLSGKIPDLTAALPRLREFNASNNELYGKVPDGVRAKFGEASFAGNARLCGSSPPLPVCSPFTGERPPPSAPSTSSPVVPSNPSSMPRSSSTGNGGGGEMKRKVGEGGLSPGAIVGIAVGNAVFLLVIASFSLAYYCGGHAEKVDEEGDGEEDKRSRGGGPLPREDGKKGNGDYYCHYYCSGRGVGEDGGGEGKLVFFDDDDERRRRRRQRQFELEDLLRASAEMLGKGSLGTVYRAVLEDGCVVAVKRLKDANPCSRKEFERYMNVVGGLRHPNLVRLRAFYYAKQEKLLVYDYLPNGTLFAHLHGNRGGGGRSGRTPLDWTTRISLVLGSARGLARIHEEYGPSKIPHGSIKSSNILLDKNGAACVSDFGLALLLNPAHATARLGGYRAPEQAEGKRLSQEADVYGFGVLLLEVLTGRAPSQYHPPDQGTADDGGGGGGGGVGVSLPEWVGSVVREEWTAEVFDAELMRYKNIEEEMVAMLHVALACLAQQPEKRPTMSEVVKMIEDIRVEQSPLADDQDESRVSLSPSAVTTEDDRLSCC